MANPTDLPFGYRLLRSLVRLRLYFRSVRLLEAERLSQTRAAILTVNSAESLATALALTAALEPPLLWMFGREATESAGGRLAARLLGAVTLSEATDSARVFEQISDALRTGRRVALFATLPATSEALGASLPVKLSIGLGQQWTEPAELAVFPVDVFAPPPRFRKWETLIAVGSAIYPAEHLHRAEGNPATAAGSLSAALKNAYELNAFRLFPSQLDALRSGLEDLLRADLRDEWAGRPDGRQRWEDFELSRFLRGWIEQTNARDPARLVALSESVARYRRARRQWSERRFAVESAGDWIASPLGQVAAGAETLAGLPVALYGWLNHWSALLGLRALRRSRKPENPDPPVEWTYRGMVVLAAYAAQIVLCDRWLGRAAAGYYALTLPVSGAYLWRYVRLWQSRTRRLLFKLWIPTGARRLHDRRRRLALQLDRQVVSEPAIAGAALTGGARLP